MSYTDFLGNTVEVGDTVVYTPKGKDSGDLVLAEVLALDPYERSAWQVKEDGSHESYILDEPGYAPTLRPIKGTNTWRFKQGQPLPNVHLHSCTSVMLYEKGKQDGSAEI